MKKKFNIATGCAKQDITDLLTDLCNKGYSKRTAQSAQYAITELFRNCEKYDESKGQCSHIGVEIEAAESGFLTVKAKSYATNDNAKKLQDLVDEFLQANSRDDLDQLKTKIMRANRGTSVSGIGLLTMIKFGFPIREALGEQPVSVTVTNSDIDNCQLVEITAKFHRDVNLKPS